MKIISIIYSAITCNANEIRAFRTGTFIRLSPCKIALVTVESDRKITAEAPIIIIRIASALLPPRNNRLLTGAESTVSPTADGIAISIANRIARAVFSIAAFRSLRAIAPDSEGISDEDSEFAIASGTCTSSIYLLL